MKGTFKAGFMPMVLSMIGVVLFTTMFSTIMTSLVSLRDTADTIVDTADNVSTAVGVTIAPVTLTESLLNSLVANVISVTSSHGPDVPVADNYTSPTLNLTGLAANVTAGDGRTITTTYYHEATSHYVALSTIIGITPTVLFLSGIFGAAFLYYGGYKKVTGSGADTSGIMRMVLGVLVIILFTTLFKTIVVSMNTLYTTYGSVTSWIAFGTVVSIAPTVLFIGGIFAGTATAASGYRSRRSLRLRRKG